jgi:hypothetical protein
VEMVIMPVLALRLDYGKEGTLCDAHNVEHASDSVDPISAFFVERPCASSAWNSDKHIRSETHHRQKL